MTALSANQPPKRGGGRGQRGRKKAPFCFFRRKTTGGGGEGKEKRCQEEGESPKCGTGEGRSFSKSLTPATPPPSPSLDMPPPLSEAGTKCHQKKTHPNFLCTGGRCRVHGNALCPPGSSPPPTTFPALRGLTSVLQKVAATSRGRGHCVCPERSTSNFFLF